MTEPSATGTPSVGDWASARPGDARERARVQGEVAARLFGDDDARLRLGRFEVRGRLGGGGIGIVYEAFDPRLERTVALKVLRREGPREGGVADPTLAAEAKALARLSHPNVVAVHEVGDTSDGDLFLAMERVAGETLRAHVRRTRPSAARILGLYLEAGRGLAAAHEAGLVHGDFKPDNVLVDARGQRVRVADFGLARRVDARGDRRRLGGTPAYMAPELRAGDAPTEASDQLAFCAALVEALTGIVPAAGSRIPHLPGLPPHVAGTVTRGLADDPKERPASMRALLAALDPGRPSLTRRIVAGILLAALVGIVVVGMTLQTMMYFDYRRSVIEATE